MGSKIERDRDWVNPDKTRPLQKKGDDDPPLTLQGGVSSVSTTLWGIMEEFGKGVPEVDQRVRTKPPG